MGFKSVYTGYFTKPWNTVHLIRFQKQVRWNFLKNNQQTKSKKLENSKWWNQCLEPRIQRERISEKRLSCVPHFGCIRKLKNAAFGGISRQEGIKARPNPKLASLPVSWDTFIWSIFEGSVDVSFAAFDIPQSCAFHSVTVELKK